LIILRDVDQTLPPASRHITTLIIAGADHVIQLNWIRTHLHAFQTAAVAGRDSAVLGVSDRGEASICGTD
jgi:hypothetical protein